MADHDTHINRQIIDCQILKQFKKGVVLDGAVIANINNTFTRLHMLGKLEETAVCDESLQRTLEVISEMMDDLNKFTEKQVREQGEA